MRARTVFVRGLSAAVAACSLAFGVAGSGASFSFAVDPVEFTLIPPVRNATVVMTNLSEDPLRLQVSVQAWVQNEDGTAKMSPTSGVIVFPQLFTLPPKSSQRVRAAIVAPLSATEQTFRIVIEDLPPLGETVRAPRGKTDITYRMRFLVPVYVEPDSPRTHLGRIEDASVRQGRLTFALVNSGNSHLSGDSMIVELRTADGASLFSRDAGRWNVFAGGRRIFTFDTGKLKCVAGLSLKVAPGGGMLPAQTVSVGECR